MLQYIRNLHLERMINIMMIVQCVGIVWLTFLFARGNAYPASLLLWINGIVFICRFGQVIDFYETNLSKLFSLLVVVEVIAFGNYLFDSSKDTALLGGLFYHANLGAFFCYSLTWYLNYVFFYIYTKKSDSVNLLKIFVVLYFIAGVLNNYRGHITFHVGTGDLTQFNYFYYALIPLPLLFYFINNKFKYIFILITLFCVVYGYKRSGIFACGLIFMANFFIDGTKGFKTFFLNCLIVATLGFGSSYFMSNNKAVERTQTRFERLESDGGSGRTTNIGYVVERVTEAPVINQIFGYGFMGHAAKYRKMVDVEFIAVLYYYGIVGWTIYLFIHLWFMRKIFMLYRNRHIVTSSIVCSYFTFYSILFFYSIAAEPFSYLFYFSLLFVYLGFIEAVLNKKYNLI